MSTEGAAVAGAPGHAETTGMDTAQAPQAPQGPRQITRPLRPYVPWIIALAGLYLVLSIAGRLIDLGDPLVTGTLAFLNFPVMIGLVVVGGLFFVRAGENADLMGARERTWGTYWGMLSWVIPVANVVLPWLYVREVWKASDPKAKADEWRHAPVPGWMVVWWAAWGGAQLLGVIGGVMGYAVGLRAALQAASEGNPEAAADVALPTWLLVMHWVTLALIVVALPFFIKLLFALVERQETRAQRLLAPERRAQSPPTGTF